MLTHQRHPCVAVTDAYDGNGPGGDDLRHRRDQYDVILAKTTSPQSVAEIRVVHVAVSY